MQHYSFFCWIRVFSWEKYSHSIVPSYVALDGRRDFKQVMAAQNVWQPQVAAIFHDPWSFTVFVYKFIILLMDKIPNNHLGWLFNPMNSGIIMILGGARILGPINSSLVYHPFLRHSFHFRRAS